MSWREHHSHSERLAAAGESAARAHDATRGRELYREAAEAESRALDTLPPEKRRTIAVTAVSAVALWYKAGEDGRAAGLAGPWVDDESLAGCAIDPLHQIVQRSEPTSVGDRLGASVDEQRSTGWKTRIQSSASARSKPSTSRYD